MLVNPYTLFFYFHKQFMGSDLVSADFSARFCFKILCLTSHPSVYKIFGSKRP